MIEIISSILDAEKKAEEIVKISNENSVKIKTNADNEGEKIKNDAITRSKIHRKAVISNAKEQAEEEYNKIIENGKLKINEEMNISSKNVEKEANNLFLEITR